MGEVNSASGGEVKQGWVSVYECEKLPGLVVVVGLLNGALSMLAFYERQGGSGVGSAEFLRSPKGGNCG